jgi:hypothetical protein
MMSPNNKIPKLPIVGTPVVKLPIKTVPITRPPIDVLPIIDPGLGHGIGPIVGPILGGQPVGVIPGLDAQVPITMLPVRIETRFAGTAAAPQLQVRIYPDDVHLDGHDARLTASEVAAGQRFWTTARSAVTADSAWAQLLKDVGPTRAIWVRQALTPTNAAGVPTFPVVDAATGSTGLAALARALPDSFFVRARYAGGESVVQGTAIPATLQVGLAFGSDGDPDVQPTAAPQAGADDTIVLDEGMRWMVDFDAAVAVGMGVTIDLPSQTSVIDEVVVVGVAAPSDEQPAGKTLAALVDAHRLSDGAAFIPPGTPTNNLADSASGYSIAEVSMPADGSVPVPGSVAAALAAALGLEPQDFVLLDGAASLELEDAAAMSRALFEATWGSYLRQQAQPGFPLAMLPQVYAHVTEYVRGGGPLPTLRLGRQPYGVLPVMAEGAWAALGEGPLEGWLSSFLQRIRPLWTSGIVDAPAGPDLFAQEPVTTRVRLRTTVPGPLLEMAQTASFADAKGNADYNRRSMMAELGFSDLMLYVLYQLNNKDAANLWLPMTADGDTSFPMFAPDPTKATSVLGLLLRNSALRIAADATNEFAGLGHGLELEQVARAAADLPIASLSEAAGRAVPVLPGFTTETIAATVKAQQSAPGKDADGATFTISDRLSAIVGDSGRFRADLTRYFNSDALAAFRDSIKSIANIPTDRRAMLTGEIIDCASFRYDAWVTSLATARLAEMQSRTKGTQLGAWGAVRGIQRRQQSPVAATGTIPDGTEVSRANGGFVLAPSPRQASAAGVLRAAWLAHGGPSGNAGAPFATGLTSGAVRRALAVAEGMRNGQQLGALLGYQLERAIHDVSGVGGVEIDWTVFVLRRQFPLKVDTIDNAPQASSERTVADGWKLAQAETATAGAVVAGILSDGDATQPPLSTAERTALQASIGDLLATLDAFADLGLSESMYQLAGANFERAAAATNMVGRASSPPDLFESTVTPRGGRGIEQRLVVTFGNATRPAGYATDTPRARLAPAADAFVARRLGPINQIHVRLLDSSGTEVASPLLSSLGLSALDIAALDLSSENITLQSWDSPLTMPGAANPNPGRAGVARLLVASGNGAAASVGFDLTEDADLIDLLDHAGAWQAALAARTPLTAETFAARAQLDSSDDSSGLAASVASLSKELAAAKGDDLVKWGIANGDSTAAAARVAAAKNAADPVSAATALLGAPAVVEGSLPALPSEVATTVGDQAGVLGDGSGVLARWLQDSARVRTAASALEGALLRDDIAGAEAVGTWAGQSPAEPWAKGVPGSAKHSWVGLPFVGELAPTPVTSVVIVGDDASGAVTGIELDAWTEVIPLPTGAAAIAANLSAPDARAPNVILLAVPPDVGKPWTQSSLFSVVDEALELSDCRMVDFAAARRIPALLPAIYLADYNSDDVGLRHFVALAKDFPVRWVSAVTT